MNLFVFALFVTVGSILAAAFISFFVLAKRADAQREEIFAIPGENCDSTNCGNEC
jgi:hypothetical protein